MIKRSGSAKWSGGLKDGTGSVSSESGALKELPYGFNTRFENTPGTNPEELIGAAHAACFSMALSNIMAGEDIVPERIETTSTVSLDKDGDGFTITKVHLVTTITADAAEEKIKELAQMAKEGCPVSKLMTAEITMEASVT